MEEEEITTDGLNDWEHLHNSADFSWSSQSSQSIPHRPVATITTRNASDDFSIFPPVNHEGLPIISPSFSPHLPLPPSNPSESPVSLVDDPSPAIPSSNPSFPPSPVLQVARWFNLSLQLLNSKIVAAFPRGRLRDIFCSIGCTVTGSVTASTFLLLLCMWVLRWRRRQRLFGEGTSTEHLKLVIKEKDEKIIELLSQIAEMNKLLLGRYKIPVLRTSYRQIQQ